MAMQIGESLFKCHDTFRNGNLVHWSASIMQGLYLCVIGGTVLDDALQFLMHQLHTAQAWLLQTLDLTFHQQFKGNLRDKKGWAGTLQGK